MGSIVHPSGVTGDDETGFSTPKITAVEGNVGEPKSDEHPQIPGWFAEHCPIWPSRLTSMNCLYIFFINEKINHF